MKYKLVIIGEGAVGKSCLTIQFAQNHYVPDYDPTIENLYRKQINVEGTALLLEILDTAGQEEYSAMRDQYIRAGQGFLVVFSVDNRKSFDKLYLYREAILQVKDTDYFPIVLLGNKIDLDNRQVTTAEASALAKSWDVPYMETSAKSRINVDESFTRLVKEVRAYERWKENGGNGEIKKGSEDIPKKKKRCILL
eukprot:TRINITY_DN6124_c0_g1_i1.p1 TRINITY_DN6124_c0_g1~~TRINITY_DN6124_c0_g1_i1.p1  ORF type:complete len:195 (-),score=38.09 TRINITY_DN6124_c0_g1_i1:52-636(-)